MNKRIKILNLTSSISIVLALAVVIVESYINPAKALAIVLLCLEITLCFVALSASLTTIILEKKLSNQNKKDGDKNG